MLTDLKNHLTFLIKLHCFFFFYNRYFNVFTYQIITFTHIWDGHYSKLTVNQNYLILTIKIVIVISYLLYAYSMTFTIWSCYSENCIITLYFTTMRHIFLYSIVTHLRDSFVIAIPDIYISKRVSEKVNRICLRNRVLPVGFLEFWNFLNNL